MDDVVNRISQTKLRTFLICGCVFFLLFLVPYFLFASESGTDYVHSGLHDVDEVLTLYSLLFSTKRKGCSQCRYTLSRKAIKVYESLH